MYSPAIFTAGSKISLFKGAPPGGIVHVPFSPGLPVMASNRFTVSLEHIATLVSSGLLPKPE